jgi:hypothetical protein
MLSNVFTKSLDIERCFFQMPSIWIANRIRQPIHGAPCRNYMVPLKDGDVTPMLVSIQIRMLKLLHIGESELNCMRCLLFFYIVWSMKLFPYDNN